MRSLLVIVAIFAVFTADCRELAGKPEDQDSAGNAHIYNDQLLEVDTLGQDPQLLHGTGSAADALIKAEMQGPVLMDELASTKRGMRRSVCKARNSCVVMGGFCVTNATLCIGRLVPEGCKRPSCQCCVPGTLELKIQSLEMELQSMRHNLTDNNEDLKMEIQSLKFNNTKANSDLKRELQSIEMNMTNANSNMDQKLDSVKDAITNQDSDISALKAANSNQDSKLNSMNSAISSQNTELNAIQEEQDCFVVGSQCFRLYMDVKRTWTSARSKCLSEGLILAEPTDAYAAILRRDVLQKYGTAQSWLGAKGDGSRLVWDNRGTSIDKDSSLLQGGRGSTMTTSLCLELDALQGEYDNYYSSPYDVVGCTTNHWTLCEVVKGYVN